MFSGSKTDMYLQRNLENMLLYSSGEFVQPFDVFLPTPATLNWYIPFHIAYSVIFLVYFLTCTESEALESVQGFGPPKPTLTFGLPERIVSFG